MTIEPRGPATNAIIPRGSHVMMPDLGQPSYSELRSYRREARAEFFREQLRAALAARKLQYLDELLQLRTELMIDYANRLADTYERNIDNPLVGVILERAMSDYIDATWRAIQGY